MPYLLLAVAILIMIRGLVKLKGSHPSHGVPWVSLLTWAVLFGGGLAAWLMAARG